jgi:hypothetical protein
MAFSAYSSPLKARSKIEGRRASEFSGKTKAKKGADFVVRDDIDLPVGKAIPMWVWEFEY